MTTKREQLELDFLAAIPSGHRVRVWTLEKKTFLFGLTRTVIEDLSAGVTYVSDRDMELGAALLSGELGREVLLVRCVEGIVRGVLLGSSYGEGSRATTQLMVEVEREVEGRGAQALLGAGRQLMAAEQASLYRSEAGLEQVWPGGRGQRITWEAPFQVTAQRGLREPVGGYGEAHLRLTQSDGAEVQRVVLTVEVPWSDALARLPALEATYPVVRGEDAAWVMAQVRRYGALHGVEVPL